MSNTHLRGAIGVGRQLICSSHSHYAEQEEDLQERHVIVKLALLITVMYYTPLLHRLATHLSVHSEDLVDTTDHASESNVLISLAKWRHSSTLLHPKKMVRFLPFSFFFCFYPPVSLSPHCPLCRLTTFLLSPTPSLFPPRPTPVPHRFIRVIPAWGS